MLGVLGRGGMGTVYETLDPALDRSVAIKVLRHALDEEKTRRLIREARALAKLSHPNVVQVYEAGEVEGQAYVAMELIRGETLEDWMNQSPRPSWRQCVAVFLSVGAGLAAAHDRGVVHRDFKPGNAIIDRSGRPRVLDFGLARQSALEPDDESLLRRESVYDEVEAPSTLTRTGAILGTPAYMSPEQIMGYPVDARSDQFSFCVTLHEALYGVRPFRGATLTDLAAAISKGKVPPAPKASPVPPRLRRVLLRGLDTNPDRRWPTMSHLLTELRGATHRRRRWGAVTVTTGTTIFGLLGWLSSRTSEPIEACPTASEQLAGVWDEDRAKALEQVFLTYDLPYARDSSERTRERLDKYAAAWGVRFEAVCASRQSTDPPHAALDAESSCLLQRREVLRALIDLMMKGDPPTIAKATEAVSELDLPHSCRVGAERAAAMPRPPPERHAAVEEARLALARAEAAYVMDRSHDGLEHAKRAREAALEAGYLPVQAETLYRLGLLHRDLGELEEAERNLTEAFREASEAGHDRLAFLAATERAFLVGYLLNREDEGDKALSEAEVALRPLDGNPLLEARLARTRAAIATVQGRYDEALAEHRRSVRLREEGLDVAHPVVASSYYNLGSVLSDMGRYDEALEAFEHAHSIWYVAYGPKHPIVAAAAIGSGAVFERMGRWVLARERFETAVRVREQALGPDSVDLAIPLDNLGSVLFRLGEYDGARRVSQHALELREQHLGIDHPHCASSLVNLGLIAEALARDEEATGFLQRALTIWRKALDPGHQYLGYPLTSLGRIAHRRGDDVQARELLERALDVRSSTDEPNLMAETELALATVLWSSDPHEARAHAKRARVRLAEARYAWSSLRQEVDTWLEEHPAPLAASMTPAPPGSP